MLFEFRYRLILGDNRLRWYLRVLDKVLMYKYSNDFKLMDEFLYLYWMVCLFVFFYFCM